MSVGLATGRTKRWLISSFADTTTPGLLRFSNPPRNLVDRAPLASLQSPGDLTLYSLSEAVDRRLGARACARAIDLSETLAKSWDAAKGHVARSYVIALGDLATLVVYERRIHFQPQKYRGAQKFSRVFKERVRQIEDVEVARVSI